MSDDDLERRRLGVVREFGRWSAHNIALSDNVYTISPEVQNDEHKARRFTQIICDLTGSTDGNLSGLRILDLGCLEGLYAIELALRGAEVVGIEGRKANLAKAEFSKDELGLDRLELALDDVRNLSVEKYGTFDVVLCLGLLYHLEAESVIGLLRDIASVCRRFAIVETHVSIAPKEQAVVGGRTYSGRTYVEHDETSTKEERERRRWSSLDNAVAFWLTEPSLDNALSDAGFTSVLKCSNPPLPDELADRITLVALRGSPADLRSSRREAVAPPPRAPEAPNTKVHGTQRPWIRQRAGKLWHSIGRRRR